MSKQIPDIRLEQLLLPYALLVFWVQARRGVRYQAGFVDWVFAALGLSTLVSILLAPRILNTRLSSHDFYELLKLVLYYALFRLALVAATTAEYRRRVVEVLIAAGGLSAAFGVWQYFGWFRVNDWLTPHFAGDPHLGVLRASGRVVGTIGNPNYFGLVCAIVALACLLSFWLRAARWSLLPVVAAPFATLGLVMSGSRSAALALVLAVAAFLVFLTVTRTFRSSARLAAGIGGLALLFALSVLVVEAFPRGQVDYLGRVGGGLNVGDDASFALRIVRWRSVLGAWSTRSASTGSVHAPFTSVHATGVAAGSPSMIARDEVRKADLLHLATAIDVYHRATGNWPDPDALAMELVPRFIAALPTDPATGATYVETPTATGYSLAATLENPADPDYPSYGIGSSPNYLLNGDLEEGAHSPSYWDTINGTKLSTVSDGSLYGSRAVLFQSDDLHPEQRSGLYQQRYFGRPGGQPFTATVWVKLLSASGGPLELYANVIYADGERADPLTRLPADMSKVGVWQRVSLWMQPPADKTVGFMGIYVMANGFRGQALLDGFQLVDGPIPLSFAVTPEAPASDMLGFNPEAKLRLSPIIGVGPEKAEQGSSLDDEYLLYAARYGLIGIILYLALFVGVLALAARSFLRSRPLAQALPALVALTVVMFLAFNIVAGSFYELQLMAVFWLSTGAAVGTPANNAGKPPIATMGEP